MDVVDKYTVRINLSLPDASLPANVMHYPTNLQAPDNFDNASNHPIGTGPFKFVSWQRFTETRLERFENYWEADDQGNQLPYLDAIIGRPKREDAVRLTTARRSIMPDSMSRHGCSRSPIRREIPGTWKNTRYGNSTPTKRNP